MAAPKDPDQPRPAPPSFRALELLEAAKLVSRCVDFAPLEELEKVHAMIYEHYMAVTEKSRHSFENASEQRLLGMLWAEIEMAIDERRTKQH